MMATAEGPGPMHEDASTREYRRREKDDGGLRDRLGAYMLQASRLHAALLPFSRLWLSAWKDVDDDHHAFSIGDHRITVGDVRRAFEAVDGCVQI